MNTYDVACYCNSYPTIVLHNARVQADDEAGAIAKAKDSDYVPDLADTFKPALVSPEHLKLEAQRLVIAEFVFSRGDPPDHDLHQSWIAERRQILAGIDDLDTPFDQVRAALATVAAEGGSFRTMIYGDLDLHPSTGAYTVLYLAGGMDYSNRCDMTGPPTDEFYCRIRHALRAAIDEAKQHEPPTPISACGDGLGEGSACPPRTPANEGVHQ